MNTTTPLLIDQVRELLTLSVPEVFSTMFTLEARPSEPEDLRVTGETLVAATVGFVGDVNGVVYLHVTAPFARILAGRMLGMTEDEFDGDEMIDDAIGELSNMVVGAVKSRLCDDGLACVLTIPLIVRGQNFSVGATGCLDRRLLSFRCGHGDVMLELQMKPAE